MTKKNWPPTFFVLLVPAEPFAAEVAVLGACSTTDEVEALLGSIDAAGGQLVVAEAITASNASSSRLPVELARGIDAWNALAGRTTPHLPRVNGSAHTYASPFRRWRKNADARDYTLVDVVAAVERAAWSHPWIEFGWLFGSKGGTLNSEKIMHGNNGLAKKSTARTISPDDEFEPEEV